MNIFKNLILYTFVIFLLFFLWKIKTIVLLFFAAFILASAIDPLVELMSKKIPRKYSLIIVSVSIFLLLLLFFIPFLNILTQQILLLLKEFPTYWEKIETFFNELIMHIDKPGVNASVGIWKWFDYIEGMGIIPEISDVMAFASELGRNILTSSLGLTKNFLSSVAFIVTVATVTLYMLMDKSYLKEGLLKLFPKTVRKKASEVLGIISKKVGNYVISQLIIVFTLGILVTIGLSLLRLEFSLILGSLAAVLELIPVVGPLIAGAIIVFVALVQNPILAIWALLIYLATEWIVDNLVRPQVLEKFLSIHPLMLIMALFVGATFFGIPGLILAPAGAAVVSVLVEELYVKRINAP